jgi:AcrR family transcriptional regulator
MKPVGKTSCVGNSCAKKKFLTPVSNFCLIIDMTRRKNEEHFVKTVVFSDRRRKMTENSLGGSSAKVRARDLDHDHDRNCDHDRTASSAHTNSLRKTDRRTMVTLEMIRRAFVSLVNRQPYSKTTVAQVCRAAGITRSTFYFHYDSLRDLLDDVLDRALQFSDDDSGASPIGSPVCSPSSSSTGSSISSSIGSPDGSFTGSYHSGNFGGNQYIPGRSDVNRAGIGMGRTDRLVPACQRAARRPEYRALLMDPDLSEYIVQRIAAHEQDRVIPEIRRNTGLSEEDARTLFLYMVHGSFAINKRHGFVRDAQWKHEADLLDRFIRAGNRAFRR